MKYLAILLLLFIVTGCYDPENDPYVHYINERVVVKICMSGTKIYKWDNRYWVRGSTWPDEQVIGPEICN